MFLIAGDVIVMSDFYNTECDEQQQRMVIYEKVTVRMN